MTRLLLSILFFLSMIVGSLTLSGCNTFTGMGKDSQESIHAFQDGPRDAYHQDARDF
jgi:predicted small secreted protein